MLKKVLVIGFLLVMIGAVIAGTVTVFAQRGENDECGSAGDRTQGIGAPRSTGRQTGEGIGQRRDRPNRESGAPQSNNSPGQSRGRELGLNAESSTEHSEWQSIEGTVVETTELVIETLSEQRIQVGLGPSHYREAQGFALNIGDQVRISGYWEGDEFKAGQVENLETGVRITLRDASGRPMWAGQGLGRNRE
jgi:hypothetical protein